MFIYYVSQQKYMVKTMPRTGLIEELARKYGMTVSEVKRIIMKYAISKARALHKSGVPWREALGRALREVWAEIKRTHALPTVRY